MPTKSKVAVSGKSETKKAKVPVYRGADAIKLIVSTGLLWYINKMAFHVCGLKLILDEARGEIVLEDHRNYPSVVYPPDVYEVGQGRFAGYMEERGLAVLKYRQQILGFDVQPPPSSAAKSGAQTA